MRTTFANLQPYLGSLQPIPTIGLLTEMPATLIAARETGCTSIVFAMRDQPNDEGREQIKKRVIAEDCCAFLQPRSVHKHLSRDDGSCVHVYFGE
jgi:hypothetical protein